MELTDVPSVRPTEVLVHVKAAGIIVAKGDLVHDFEFGDRVYVNPGRYCGSCRQCVKGNETGCDYFVLSGYFGMGLKSAQMFEDYKYGTLAEYMPAPRYSTGGLGPDVVVDALPTRP